MRRWRRPKGGCCAGQTPEIPPLFSKYSRPNWRKERQTNQETFGPYAVRNQSNFQRRPAQNRYQPMNRQGRNYFNGGCNSTQGFRSKPRMNNYVPI